MCSMHIWIVAPEQIPVPPIMGGSVEICIHAIAQKLAQWHQVTIISKRHPRYKHVTRSGNLTIIRVASKSHDLYLTEVLKVLRKAKQMDLIQVDNRPRYAAAIKRHLPSTPVSLFLHSLTFVKPPHSSISTTAAQLSKVDLIIANSSSLKSKLGQLYPKQRQKIETVLLGVDISRFSPPSTKQAAAVRRKFGLGQGFKVLFTGRLIPQKGVDVLIHAMKIVKRSVPDVQLVIAGGEQKKGYAARLKELARKQGVRAIFVGYIPHSQVHRIYWLGDCLVCPSQGHEAFGLVNVEAMASGLPVIASDNGGIKEIVKHGYNGLLVRQFRKPVSFANSIITLAANSSYTHILGQQSRADAVNRFGWHATAERLSNVYWSMLKG
ncbi:Spore coat protein SA [compost metagenome]